MSAIMSVTNNVFRQATPIEDDARMQRLSDVASSALKELEREATEAEDEYDSPEELLQDLMEEMEEAEEPESEIECTNPFNVLMSSGAESSEASGTDDYNTAEELDDTAYDADAETDAADGVEEKVSALQSPIPPPGQRKSKRKRTRKRKSQNERINPAAAKKKKGGARLILNKTEEVSSDAPNTRTCLLESVLALVPTRYGMEDNETKELVRAGLLTAMPAEGDTSVADLANALRVHGLSLVPVSGEYRKKGGVEFNLLQERRCKLVINLRLTDLDGDAMSHFVAWDGDCIHDRPYLSKVNNTYDRTNPEKSKLAFAKLFKPTEFQSWQVTSVYRLCQ